MSEPPAPARRSPRLTTRSRAMRRVISGRTSTAARGEEVDRDGEVLVEVVLDAAGHGPLALDDRPRVDRDRGARAPRGGRSARPCGSRAIESAIADGAPAALDRDVGAQPVRSGRPTASSQPASCVSIAASAPSRRPRSSRAARWPSRITVVAPAARATWSVMSPTAPSPTIATESPRRTPAWRTARTATSVVSMSAASSSRDLVRQPDALPGRHLDVLGEAAVAVQADRGPVDAERVLVAAAVVALPAEEADVGDDPVADGEAPSTPAPTSTISPANSWPSVTGAHWPVSAFGRVHGDDDRAVAVLLDVGPADAAPAHAEEDLAGPDASGSGRPRRARRPARASAPPASSPPSSARSSMSSRAWRVPSTAARADRPILTRRERAR